MLSATYAPAVYTAAASQTQFIITFSFGAPADLEVYVNEVLTSSWSVSGTTLTFSAGLAAGDIVYIGRKTVFEQTYDGAVAGPVDLPAIEASLDDVVRQVQDIASRLDRAVVLTKFDATDALAEVDFRGNSGKAFIVAGGEDAVTFAPLTVTVVGGADPAGWVRLVATGAVASSNGASQLTFSNVVPANALIVGAILDVTTEFGATNGLTTVQLGTSWQLNKYGSAISRLVSTSNCGQWRDPSPFNTAATEDLVLSAVGGTFDATGAATVYVFYAQFQTS